MDYKQLFEAILTLYKCKAKVCIEYQIGDKEYEKESYYDYINCFYSRYGFVRVRKSE